MLIHTNGRVYDYNLGRFLSVDPFIQGIGNSQGINPYSYVMNNPLGDTDPTGYTAEKEVEVKRAPKLGSRLGRSQTVTVTAKDGGLSISGGNGAARSAVRGALTNSLSSAGFNVADIGSQGNIAKTDKVASTTTTPSISTQGNSLSSDIQSQTQDTLSSIGQDFGYGYGEGVTAKYSELGYNEDGNINQATISCDFVCQKDGAEYGKITADNIAQRAMIMNFRHGQSQAADALAMAFSPLATAYGGLGLRSGYQSIAHAFKNLPVQKRNALFGIYGEIASILNGAYHPVNAVRSLVPYSPAIQSAAFRYAPGAEKILRKPAIKRFGAGRGKPKIRPEQLGN
ncbi:RHS repeat protein [Alteromonas lipotrueiana]|uniref:RHS repeat protein n=1 Tax=Alteromonas lipotrueiana TaxID=2803815 RepID=UPI001FEA5A19|nr:RHS repeat-associated core domain-containing protein [Alteromonas lipotrueiana]